MCEKAFARLSPAENFQKLTDRLFKILILIREDECIRNVSMTKHFLEKNGEKNSTKIGKLDLHGLTSTYMDLQLLRYVLSTIICILVIKNRDFRGGFKGLQEASTASRKYTLQSTVNNHFFEKPFCKNPSIFTMTS